VEIDGHRDFPSILFLGEAQQFVLRVLGELGDGGAVAGFAAGDAELLGAADHAVHAIELERFRRLDDLHGARDFLRERERGEEESQKQNAAGHFQLENLRHAFLSHRLAGVENEAVVLDGDARHVAEREFDFPGKRRGELLVSRHD